MYSQEKLNVCYRVGGGASLPLPPLCTLREKEGESDERGFRIPVIEP